MTDSEPEETDADPDDTDKDDDPTWDPNHAHTTKTTTTAFEDDDVSETEEEDVERKGEIARPAANAAGGNVAPPYPSRQDASGGTVGILVEGGGKSRRKAQKQDSPSRRFIGVGNFKNITGERGGRPYYATISVKREDGTRKCSTSERTPPRGSRRGDNKRALELGRDRLNVIEDVQLLSGGSTPEAKRARSSPSHHASSTFRDGRLRPRPARAPPRARARSRACADANARPRPRPCADVGARPPRPHPAPELAPTPKPKDGTTSPSQRSRRRSSIAGAQSGNRRSRMTFERDMALARAAAASAGCAEMNATDPNGVGSVSERFVASARARDRDEKHAAAYASLAAHFRASRDYNEAAAEAEEAEEARTRSNLGRSTR